MCRGGSIELNYFSVELNLGGLGGVKMRVLGESGVSPMGKVCFWGVRKCIFDHFRRLLELKLFPVTVIFYSTPPTAY